MYRPACHFAAIAVISLLPVVAIGADATQDHAVQWKQAQEIVAQSGALVADTITTDMEMFDGDGASMGTMRIQERISGWKDHEATRVIYANDHPEHEAFAKSLFKVGVDNHPENALLLEHANVERTETASLDGKSCIVFYLGGMTGQKANIAFKGKVWVEEASGRPLKAFTEFLGLPHTKAMTREIVFGEKDGQWLPASAVVDATVSMLFQKARIVAKYQFGTWAPRRKET